MQAHLNNMELCPKLSELDRLCPTELILHNMHWGDFWKRHQRRLMEKSIKGKMLSIGDTFLTKHKFSAHEAFKRGLYLPMRHSNIDVLYVHTGLRKNRTRMVKSVSVWQKMHLDDTNVFASDIIDKYKNRPYNLHSTCLADFVSSYVSKKADDLPIDPEEMNSYTVSVSNINDVKLNSNIIVLKNELGVMRKHSSFPALEKWECIETGQPESWRKI